MRIGTGEGGRQRVTGALRGSTKRGGGHALPPLIYMSDDGFDLGRIQRLSNAVRRRTSAHTFCKLPG